MIKGKILIQPIVAIIATLIVYLFSIDNELIHFWDNPGFGYIEGNRWIQHLNLDNLWMYFTQPFDNHYHPLTLLSLAIDYQIGGTNPLGYHITTICIHLLTVWFVYLFIKSLTGNATIAFFSAIIYGIHPLNVESVTWLSERKNVLFGMFYFASLTAYIYYIRYKDNRIFWLSVFLYLLSLSSKAQGVSLAGTVFLIDYFFARKLNSSQVLKEKIPFVFLAIAFLLIGHWAHDPSSFVLLNSFSFFDRLCIGSHNFITFITSTLAPYNIAAYYPYPVDVTQSISEVLWPYFIIFLIFVILIVRYRRSRMVVFSIGFFAINIFLLLKMFDMPYANFLKADRYMYIPIIGIILLISVLFEKLIHSVGKYRYLLYIIPVIYISYLFFYSIARVDVWQNDLTFYSNLIERYPDMQSAWGNRAKARQLRNDNEGAMADFNQLIHINPTNDNALVSRGSLKASIGELHQALADFNSALKINPDNSAALSNKAITTFYLGDTLNAIELIRKTIHFHPDFADAWLNSAIISYQCGHIKDADNELKKAISLGSDNYSVIKTLQSKIKEQATSR